MRSATATFVVFAGTIFLSAFLLFQIQPLVSKFILPWFGGTPAVWTGAMLFFQLVLFGGYFYAHLLSKWCTIHQRLTVHLSVLALAAANVAWGRLIPPESLRPQGEAGEIPLIQLLLLLTVTVGIPYFSLSATGPLLQRWLHDSLPGVSPYRLFALSNLGSLLALLSYPFFFEVQWGVVAQASIWSVGYVLFVVICACCAIRTWQLSKPATRVANEQAASVDKSIPIPEKITPAVASLRDKAIWLGLPTLASVMFLATTNEVCQNVASVPLMWVIPLSLYLVTFIIAFDHPRWYPRQIVAWSTLVLLAFVIYYDTTLETVDQVANSLLGSTADDSIELGGLWWLQASIYFLTMFAIALMCHGELARARPAPQYLTSYYLMMSFGGALGGLLVNLAAPFLFNTFFEFPLALMTAALVAIVLIWAGSSTSKLRWPAVGGAVALGATSIVGLLLDSAPSTSTHNKTVHVSRSFYGIVEVMHRAIGDVDENYTFYSGTIQHGKQLAEPTRRAIPLTYYGAGSGCEVAIKFAQARSEQCRIGVIGLGVGTIATYARSTDSIRLYEINPKVIDIAQDQRWFHFLSDCRCKPELVLGDARLQLERELKAGGSQKFDLLVVDAFSGDSIPTHLLTREAFDVYQQHLAPGGLLVVHITNTHLDLFPVVSKLADQAGFGYRRIYQQGDLDRLLYRNYYMLLSKDETFLAQTRDQIDDLPDYLRHPRNIPLWTDDYTNLTALLR
ncbi:fused MFS/spermidine synthase [Anatilimnocola aggregata]|nr:fused MFS/spermidine synthase [Anatilimnocola aggregata]